MDYPEFVFGNLDFGSLSDFEASAFGFQVYPIRNEIFWMTVLPKLFCNRSRISLRR